MLTVNGQRRFTVPGKAEGGENVGLGEEVGVTPPTLTTAIDCRSRESTNFAVMVGDSRLEHVRTVT
jgi:hypothetical protein